MNEQIQKYARKHIKGGCYLKVTLGHRGLKCLAGKNQSHLKFYQFGCSLHTPVYGKSHQ
jgi:hypothetical protein